MASKLIAVVAGVGPGTGASVARKFAKAYPVVLLARKPENFEGLADEINSSGGKAVGISTDVSDLASLKNAVDVIKKEFGQDVGAAVCRAVIRSRKRVVGTDLKHRQRFSTHQAAFCVNLFSRFLKRSSPNHLPSV